MSEYSAVGLWDAAYCGVSNPAPYGEEKTYVLGAAFLGDLAVEDWGCGLAWYRKFAGGPYRGIDGSASRFADQIVDLHSYRSETAGLFMRHVLEHNRDWVPILRNALASFTQRMVLVLFTPLEMETRVLTELEYTPGVRIPTLSLGRGELEREFHALPGLRFREEQLLTTTEYGIEYVFYLEKGQPAVSLGGTI